VLLVHCAKHTFSAPPGAPWHASRSATGSHAAPEPQRSLSSQAIVHTPQAQI
jgi:hypothetical protein